MPPIHRSAAAATAPHMSRSGGTTPSRATRKRTRLILTCGLSPGDITVMTAAVRELHRQYPGRYETDVRTSCGAIWEHNPYLTRLDDDAPSVRRIAMHYDGQGGGDSWANINRGTEGHSPPRHTPLRGSGRDRH